MSPTVKKPSFQLSLVFFLSLWYSNAAAPGGLIHTVPGVPGGTSLPSSSRILISAVGHGWPTVPGLREPLVRLHRRAATFGRRVVLVDARPPPVEHRALRRDRTRRGGVHDVRPAGHVVLRPLLLGQREQPVEHRRDEMRRRHLVLVDALERAFRRPLVHQDDGVSEMQRRRVEHDLGRVVQRTDRQVHAVARLEVEHQREERHRRAALVRVRVGHLAPDALRVPRRAGCVHHRLAGREIVRTRRRLTLGELADIAEALDLAGREPRLVRNAGLVARRLHRVGEPFAPDDDLRVASP